MTDTPRELTAREELEEIAEVLREAAEAEKAAADLKAEVRGPFFELISEIVREEVTLARVVEEVGNDGFDAEAWRKLNYPLYRIVGMNVDGDDAGILQITLEEDERYRKFEFSVGGYKFGRTVKMTGKGFEAEAFVTALENGAFDDLVDEEVLARLQNCIKKEIVTVYSANETEMSSLMSDHPEAVAIFQEYINPGTPSVALLPIKAIKESDEA